MPSTKENMFHQAALNFITYTAYFGPFLIFLLPIFLWVFKRQARRFRALSLLLIMAAISLSYMRFIEPKIILINSQTSPEELGGFRFALISDIHVGLYKREVFLKKAMTQIQELNTEENPLDFVLLAGDLVYQVNPKHMATLLEPLGQLYDGPPIYAVLGNHDIEPAGELSKEEGELLHSILEDLNVQVIDNRIITFEKNGQKVQILGFGELWNHEADLSILEQIDPSLPSLAMVHNPDLAYDLPENSVDFLVAGHTHGGQIRIPFLYPHIIPTRYNFGKGQGWYKIKQNPLFITTGLGESGLPLRLGVPPEIVVFEGLGKIRSTRVESAHD